MFTSVGQKEEIEAYKTDEKDTRPREDKRRGQAAVREKRQDVTSTLTCICNNGLLEAGILLLGLVSAIFLSVT